MDVKMRMFTGTSIRHKLTSIIILTSCIALLLACVAFIIYDRITLKNRLVTEIETLAHIIGQNCTAALQFKVKEDAAEILATLKDSRNIKEVCILTRDDEIFAKYPEYISDDQLILDVNIESGSHFSNDFLYVKQYIIDEGENVGKVYIKSDLQAMNQRLKQYIYIACIFLIASIFVVSVISLRLQHIISDPILHLAKVARDVSVHQDFTIRANNFSGDELGFLTDRFNAMLEQIQDRDIALQKTHDELKRRAQQLQLELGERKLAERQLLDSLKEKEVLLREIHHRVKNNLQVISSLIYLQTKNIKDSEAIRLFKEGQNRVKSMALVHEELYNSKNLTHIDFSKYVKNLAKHLYHSYQEEVKTIQLITDVDQISLSIDTAISCGMIINELASNSLKHAFPRKKSGKILIKLYAEEITFFTLIVEDNGVGIPEDFDFKNTTSLGLQLVCNLTDQLNGTIQLDRSAGTKFTIQFSEPKIEYRQLRDDHYKNSRSIREYI